MEYNKEQYETVYNSILTQCYFSFTIGLLISPSGLILAIVPSRRSLLNCFPHHSSKWKV